MTKPVKIIFISVAILGLAAGGYFAIRYYRLKKSYETKLSVDDIIKIIQESTKNLSPEMENDPDLHVNNGQSGVMVTDDGGINVDELTDDELDMLDDIIYESQGGYSNDELDSMGITKDIW